MFSCGLGLNAGPALVDLLLRPEGWKVAILATIIVAVCCAAQAIASRYLGLSACEPRGLLQVFGAAGGFASGRCRVGLMSVSRAAIVRPLRSSSKFSWCHLSGHCELRSNSWQHRTCSGITSARGAPMPGLVGAPLSSYEAVMELGGHWRSPIDPSSVEVVAERADNHAWTPVTGIIDPGEEPLRLRAERSLKRLRQASHALAQR